MHIKYCEYRVIIDYDERINEGYIECEKTEYGNKSLYRYHIEASIIFDFSPASHWEDGNYVIRRNTHLEYVCEVLNLNLEQVEEKALQIAKKLHSYRKDRI